MAPKVASGDGVFEAAETTGELTADVADGGIGGTTIVDVAGPTVSAGVELGAAVETLAVVKLGKVAVAANSVAPTS